MRVRVQWVVLNENTRFISKVDQSNAFSPFTLYLFRLHYKRERETYPNFLSVLFQLYQEIVFNPFDLLDSQDLVNAFCLI